MTDLKTNEEFRMKNEELRSPDIYDRIFNFACRVLQMERTLVRSRTVNRAALSQLVRSATSVGANLEEAKAAQSKVDFHAKLRISLKEAREAHYWLRLFGAANIIRMSRLEPLITEANEIVAILTTIAKKSNPRNPSTS